MAQESNKKCAHPACTCNVGSDQKYCSQYCKDSGSTTEIACNCGHANCGVGAKTPSMTAR